MIIELAVAKDVDEIVALFKANQTDPGLFQQSQTEVTRNLTDFEVARDARGRVVGCAGLHRESDELGEIFGVAVHPEFQGQGVGTALINGCKQRAVANGMNRLWLATVKVDYFRRHSFHTISRWSLPTSVRLRKLMPVFRQPIRRWVPVLLGRHTVMACDLRDESGANLPRCQRSVWT